MSELFDAWISHCEMEDANSPSEKASAQSRAHFILSETKKSFQTDADKYSSSETKKCSQSESDQKSQPLKKRKRKGSVYIMENGEKKQRNSTDEEDEDQLGETSPKKNNTLHQDNSKQEKSTKQESNVDRDREMSPSMPSTSHQQPLDTLKIKPLKIKVGEGNMKIKPLKIKVGEGNQSKVLFISNNANESTKPDVASVIRDEFHKASDHDYSSQYGPEEKNLDPEKEKTEDDADLDADDEGYKQLQVLLKKNAEAKRKRLEIELEKEQLEKTQKYRELAATKNELKKNLKELETKIASNFKYVEELQVSFDKENKELGKKAEGKKLIVKELTGSLEVGEVEQKEIEEAIKIYEEKLKTLRLKIKSEEERKDKAAQEVERIENLMAMERAKLDGERKRKEEENKNLDKKLIKINAEIASVENGLNEILQCKLYPDASR